MWLPRAPSQSTRHWALHTDKRHQKRSRVATLTHNAPLRDTHHDWRAHTFTRDEHVAGCCALVHSSVASLQTAPYRAAAHAGSQTRGVRADARSAALAQHPSRFRAAPTYTQSRRCATSPPSLTHNRSAARHPPPASSTVGSVPSLSPPKRPSTIHVEACPQFRVEKLLLVAPRRLTCREGGLPKMESGSMGGAGGGERAAR